MLRGVSIKVVPMGRLDDAALDGAVLPAEEPVAARDARRRERREGAAVSRQLDGRQLRVEIDREEDVPEQAGPALGPVRNPEPNEEVGVTAHTDPDLPL